MNIWPPLNNHRRSVAGMVGRAAVVGVEDMEFEEVNLSTAKLIGSHRKAGRVQKVDFLSIIIAWLTKVSQV